MRVSLKGDTAWEEPPMLDMAVEQFNAGIAEATAMAADTFARFAKLNVPALLR